MAAVLAEATDTAVVLAVDTGEEVDPVVVS